MAYSSIIKPSDYFNTILTTGGAKSITGVGFQPDWVWNKRRDDTSDHHINDAVRGSSKLLYTNQQSTEQTNATFLTSFDSDGFTTGSGYWNNSASIVAWNWKANGQGSANSDGTITTTYTSANQTAGFSISLFTVSGSGNVTFGHGLNAKPKVVITKSTSHTTNWNVYHEDTSTSPEDDYLYLNSSAVKASATDVWGDGMTTSVAGLGVNIGVSVGRTYVAYCFAEKNGYSKFGSYTGNASTNGPFIYTGFKPAWVLIKTLDNQDGHWRLSDNKRGPFNPSHALLFPSSNVAENTTPTGNGNDIEYYSNGFKITTDNVYANGSGNKLLYMAFAEEPLVANVGQGVPATAR